MHESIERRRNGYRLRPNAIGDRRKRTGRAGNEPVDARVDRPPPESIPPSSKRDRRPPEPNRPRRKRTRRRRNRSVIVRLDSLVAGNEPVASGIDPSSYRSIRPTPKRIGDRLKPIGDRPNPIGERRNRTGRARIHHVVVRFPTASPEKGSWGSSGNRPVGRCQPSITRKPPPIVCMGATQPDRARTDPMHPLRSRVIAVNRSPPRRDEPGPRVPGRTAGNGDDPGRSGSSGAHRAAGMRQCADGIAMVSRNSPMNQKRPGR